MKKIFCIAVGMFLYGGTLWAQQYDLVIKGGTVIDPKNNIYEKRDVAIKDGRIVEVAPEIEGKLGKQLVDAVGSYVTPGLIDLHTHHYWGTNLDQAYMNGPNAFPPDGFSLRNGVTTVVDAGSPGAETFYYYKEQTIKQSKTRVLAFLNIAKQGMRGGHFEQDTTQMEASLAAKVAKDNPEHIVGFKVAHFEGRSWAPVDQAVKASDLAGGLPVMVDFGGANPPLPIQELFFDHLRPGDIFTHAFAEIPGREYIVDIEKKRVKPFVHDARKKGIKFDVGYGGISFSFSQAVPAVKEGFYPDAISTDIHIGSMNGAMKDMLTVMSKFLVMGMDLPNVIAASTWQPAQIIKRESLGHLSVGALADIAILHVRKGNFGYFDYKGTKVKGQKKLECELTIRDGKIVYDLNGIAEPLVVRTP
ncbi:amidohydrolase/deacetylase family metallohydrolase [Olivibacter sp. SDN3]|uniref:amidohydrolase/deacetylase family metallohydrolase n=1 Tax=Olivibacter sp. SDN3 TaxID=2764720 RepID=UPI001651866A|nr:amidohydrolase/deacetylase family metallohydrolase [Olivibacter sp. SDN3]QNL50757.1 amidohydrolase/deacetylase family metallohydrolase [Olivibacter sp. SDN3]